MLVIINLTTSAIDTGDANEPCIDCVAITSTGFGIGLGRLATFPLSWDILERDGVPTRVISQGRCRRLLGSLNIRGTISIGLSDPRPR